MLVALPRTYHAQQVHTIPMLTQVPLAHLVRVLDSFAQAVMRAGPSVLPGRTTMMANPARLAFLVPLDHIAKEMDTPKFHAQRESMTRTHLQRLPAYRVLLVRSALGMTPCHRIVFWARGIMINLPQASA